MSTKAEIEITASTARLPAALRSAMKMVQGFVSNTVGLLARSDRKRDPDVASIARGAAIGGVASNLAVRGLDILTDQAKGVYDFQKELTRLGIAARLTPAHLHAVELAARETSNQTGLSAIDVLRAGKAYMDLAGASAFTVPKMNLLARAAQASGAKTTDLAGMMYQLTETMKLTDDQVEQTMGGLINQAKDGAIEAKDMAAEFAGILPLFARFKDALGPDAAIQAGAMFQVIRKGFNSASEAGTGIQRIFAGLRTYGSRFEANGVKIWDVGSDGVKRARSIGTIMKEIAGSKLVKDPELMKKAFGRTEGWRSMELLLENVKQLAELEASGHVKGVIGTDLAAYTESSAGRLEIAMERIKNKIAEAFTPERIEKFVNAIEGLADKIGPLVEAFGKIGDGLGKLYGVGKSVRGFIGTQGGSFGSPLAGTTPEKAAQYAAENNVSMAEAYQKLQAIYDKSRQFKKDIAGTVIDDKTTPASNKIAARALMTPRTIAGEDERTLAEDYVRAVGLTQDQVRDLKSQLLKEDVDKDIREGRGQSKRSFDVDFGAEMLKAIQAAAPMIGAEVSKSMRQSPPSIAIDGNPVAKAAGNATDSRRKP